MKRSICGEVTKWFRPIHTTLMLPSEPTASPV